MLGIIKASRIEVSNLEVTDLVLLSLFTNALKIKFLAIIKVTMM